MTTPPDFSVGQVLTAAHMDAVGLWKITSGTIAGLTTSGQNITSVFNNTDYQNYRLIINTTATSTTNRLELRWLNGTTQANSSYYAGGVGGAFGSDAVTYFQRSNNDSRFLLNVASTEPQRNWAIDIFNVNQARQTFINGSFSDSTPLFQHFGGMHNVATAYDGFHLFTSGGTLDLTYALYGYRN